MIATRYCLDNETEKGYSNMFKNSVAWRNSIIDPDKLLRIEPTIPSDIKLTDEKIKDLLDKMYSESTQLERFPSLQQAVEKAKYPFDGHTSKDVLQRLKDL